MARVKSSAVSDGGTSTSSRAIVTLPIGSLHHYDNPRNEPAHLYALGYKLFGDTRVVEPRPDAGEYVSLVRMALSDDLAQVAKYVALIETCENVDRSQDPTSPQTIVELAEDIALFGQLVPIHIHRDHGKVVVIDGGRRIAAILWLHARTLLQRAGKEIGAPRKVYPAVVDAIDLDLSGDDLFVAACKINLSRKQFDPLQEGRIYYEMKQKINPDTGRRYTGKQAAIRLGVHYSTFRNRESLWHPYDPKTGKGLTDRERMQVANGTMLATFASRKSLGERHYSQTGTPRKTKRRAIPLVEMQRLFDCTPDSQGERRQAIAECMGLRLKQAISESDARIAAEDTGRPRRRRRTRGRKKRPHAA